MLRRTFALVAAALALSVPAAALAAAVDVSVGASDISLSPALASYPAGTAVRVYVRIHNAGQEDALASATVTAGGVEVGQASPVPVRAGGSAETWLDWTVPNKPFSLGVAVSAEGDAQQRNNRAETGQYAVSSPTERDIFAPPVGRDGVTPTSSTMATSTTDASSTVPTTSEPIVPSAPVEYVTEPPVPVTPDGAPLEEYSWIPYVLIALGAVGFAWGMRGRRRGSSYRTAVPVPVSVVRPPRRRPARPKVYRPELVVEKAASKPRRAPRRRPTVPPEAPTQ